MTTRGVTDPLIGRLDEASIPYCHWKGNHALPAVLDGDKDFELLVDETRLAETEEVLRDLGYKLGVAPYAAEPSGVAHYFGPTIDHDRLSHVHLHSRIVTGEKLVANHHLPLESEILDGAREIDGIRQTDRSTELVMLALRTALQRTSPLDAIYRLRERDRRSQEWRWLREDATDVTTAVKVVAEALDVDPGVLGRGVEVLDGPSSGIARLRSALAVRRELQAFRIHGRLRQAARQAELAVNAAARRALRRPGGKRLEGGGRVIAIVGPDASGKSTMVSTTAHWLGEHFQVLTIHAGKPPTALLTVPFNAMSAVLRRTGSGLRMSRVEGHSSSEASADDRPAAASPRDDKPPPATMTRLLYGARSVATAWDRRKLLRRARRHADKGILVICDRYPSQELGAMDSPRLPRYAGGGSIAERLADRMARWEQRIYADIPPPDFVVSLTVPLEKALARNEEREKWDKEDADYVASRHRSAKPWRRDDCADVVEVNTGGSLEETAVMVRRAVWERL